MSAVCRVHCRIQHITRRINVRKQKASISKPTGRGTPSVLAYCVFAFARMLLGRRSARRPQHKVLELSNRSND